MSSNEKLKAEALALLPGLKSDLGDAAANVPDKQLLKFLHWKPDIKRASERFRAHLKWRSDNPWAFDNPLLRVSSDDRLQELLKNEFMIAPESIASEEGSAVLVGRLRNNDMNDGRTPVEVVRTIIYLIDRVLEREEAQLNGVVIFHDLNGLSKNNIHPSIPKMLFGAIIGNFPVRIKGIYLLNPPFFFKGVFGVVKTLFFSKKLKGRVHHMHEIDDIYDVIDKAKLLEEHGGELKFDPSIWVGEQQKLEEKDDFGSLHSCVSK